MTPETSSSGSARSAAEWNDRIRAFWQGLDGRAPTAEERARYEGMLEQWTAAVRAEIVKAA